MPVHIADSPLTCVAVGSGRSLEEFEAIHRSCAPAPARAGGTAAATRRRVRVREIDAPDCARRDAAGDPRGRRGVRLARAAVSRAELSLAYYRHWSARPPPALDRLDGEAIAGAALLMTCSAVVRDAEVLVRPRRSAAAGLGRRCSPRSRTRYARRVALVLRPPPRRGRGGVRAARSAPSTTSATCASELAPPRGGAARARGAAGLAARLVVRRHPGRARRVVRPRPRRDERRADPSGCEYPPTDVAWVREMEETAAARGREIRGRPSRSTSAARSARSPTCASRRRSRSRPPTTPRRSPGRAGAGLAPRSSSNRSAAYGTQRPDVELVRTVNAEHNRAHAHRERARRLRPDRGADDDGGDAVIETERLTLRRFREDDRDTVACWNADADYTRHLSGVQTRAQSDEAFDRWGRHWEEHGFGLCAVEWRETGELIGRAGLQYHGYWPADPEVGWSLDPAWWGRGVATEAGAACIVWGVRRAGAPAARLDHDRGEPRLAPCNGETRLRAARPGAERVGPAPGACRRPVGFPAHASRTEPLARPRARLHRAVHGRARRDDRERRAPVHSARPALHADRPAVGRQPATP